jgi:L-ribulokinase
MGKVDRAVYRPDPERARAYDDLYAEYVRLHEHFGRRGANGGNDVMHRLRALRAQAISQKTAQKNSTNGKDGR